MARAGVARAVLVPPLWDPGGNAYSLHWRRPSPSASRSWACSNRMPRIHADDCAAGRSSPACWASASCSIRRSGSRRCWRPARAALAGRGGGRTGGRVADSRAPCIGVDDIARRHPRLTIIVDHLGVLTRRVRSRRPSITCRPCWPWRSFPMCMSRPPPWATTRWIPIRSVRWTARSTGYSTPSVPAHPLGQRSVAAAPPVPAVRDALQRDIAVAVGRRPRTDHGRQMSAGCLAGSDQVRWRAGADPTDSQFPAVACADLSRVQCPGGGASTR